ncbi:glycoside hydrolase family 32 protein [Cellulomonas dongxiuzhuiae]|uniref:beta-fructofuranosidase n=1 Tax=Cellulomonas dongxiuzhuiae TaxID=2819979 RepID=A0ABX8GHS8_9CELL|nr:glycoside hydrolase family 32 protein [Cellulomonas dongxiuzhuiae]MBO3094747.1 glycoside hydrolase family 32 protein [Cellulomonas dongxiuzhuiae]QWC15747.1 glycoside hydrolase family 32 protein [Cellulomonas dongxiuzhuiae]
MTTPDPHAPRWHVRAPRGWLNDPNGIGWWDGRWHVMYQWNPHAPVWGDIHWGHASSPDLLRWEHQATALTPRPGTLDAGGAWSGVAVHDGGDVALVYSAVATAGDTGTAGVAVARRGPDGRWVQPERWAAPHPDVPGVVDVRDPFLVTVEGRRLGIQGAGTPFGGAVLVYDATDLDDWRLLGTLVVADDVPAGVDAPGRVWECPQLVHVDRRWVLLVSWFDRTVEPERLGVTAYTGRLDLDGDAPRFVVDASTPLDHGPDLYAPQALVTDDGRVLVWGWSWESRDGSRTAEEVAAAGWAGLLSCPRELAVTRDGRVVTRPATELAGLRGEPLDLAGGDLVTDEPAWRVEASLGVELALVDGDDVVTVWATDGPAEVLVDGSLVEAFEPSRGSTTRRVYRDAGQRWRVRVAGDAQAHVLRVPSA